MPMQVTETLSEGLKRELKVVVSSTEIQEQVQAKLSEIARTVRLPGFRPGKAPISLLKQRFGRAVMGEVLESTLKETSEKALDERGFKPAMQPEVDIESFEEQKDLEYTLKLEIMPEIQPIDFSQIKVERLVAEADEKSIDETVERLASQNRSATKVEEDRPAKEGDVLVIDFVGKIDGEAFAGGTASGYELELGGGAFIPGFEDQLVGAKAGEHREVTVKFPDDYGAEHLAGKEAVFEVDVTEIREYEAAVVDDELAKSMGLDSLEELRKSIKERIESEYAAAGRNRVKRTLFDELEKAHDFPIPASLVDQEFQGIWAQVKQQLEGDQGEELREGKSDEELEAEYRKVAERRVKLGLLLAEVGRLNNISVNQDDLNQAIRAQLARFPGQEQQVYEFYQQNPSAIAQLQAPILEDKVVDFILELADVTEKKVAPEELLRDPDEGEGDTEAGTGQEKSEG